MNQPSIQPSSDRFIVQVDPEIEDIVPIFLQNRRDDVESLSKALEDGDFETIRILGHSMKGSGGGYGFDAITDIGNCLEQAAKSQSLREIRRLIEELASYLNRVEVVYEQPQKI